MRKELSLTFKKEHFSHHGERQLLFEDENKKEYYWRTLTHRIFVYGDNITCTAEIKQDKHLFNVRAIKFVK